MPDPTNPRYSYGGGKIISELMAINYGRKFFERVLIFRPHNVYGPDMGFEHVIPQFALRLQARRRASQKRQGAVRNPGRRRARPAASAMSTIWCAGVMVMRDKGEHLGIYHVGTTEEITIADRGAADRRPAGRDIEFVSRPAPAGGTTRRCPDIGKLAQLGYAPQVPLAAGPAADGRLVLGQREPCAESLIRCITGCRSRRLIRVFPPKVARAAGTGGSVPVERCQICGHEKLETVLSLGYMPPVNQMVPIGAGAAAAAVVSDRPAVLRATANWCSSASRSIRSSSSRRNIPTPAA